jgi:hypothetical protein
MAIKVDGIIVLNNDRTLQNIAGGSTANVTSSNGVFSNVVDVTGSARYSIVSVPALNIDCSLGNYFTKTISTNSIFTFGNAPAGKAYSFLLELTQTSGSVTWPAAVVWPDDFPPALTSGKTHLFMFLTDNGGTTWRGTAAANYSS